MKAKCQQQINQKVGLKEFQVLKFCRSMPPSKNKMSGKAVPPSQLLEQMEKMNDMLNAENKMMEEKIGEMNRENVEWMK